MVIKGMNLRNIILIEKLKKLAKRVEFEAHTINGHRPKRNLPIFIHTEQKSSL